MVENQDDFAISESEKNALVEAILARQQDKKQKKIALTLEMQEILRKGSNSGDKEIEQLCCLLAYEATEAFYSKKAASYVDRNRTEFGDLQSELYILISQNLHKYNGKHSLFTFFDPLVKRSFAKAREQGRGLNSSRYFRDLGPFITKAQEELKKIGLENPTSMDLSDYIRVKRGKVIAGSTIEQWIIAHKTDTSLNDFGDVFKDANENNSPEASLIKREETDEFYVAISKTSPASQEILLAEVAHIEKHGLIPTVKDLYPTLLQKNSSLRLQDAELLVTHAHNELKSVLTGKKQKPRRLPLNKAKVDTNKLKFFKEDDENIMLALDNSLDNILPKKEEL